jgi:hypothetical protein
MTEDLEEIEAIIMEVKIIITERIKIIMKTINKILM